MPKDTAARLQAMRATGADVVKLAARADTLSDCAALLAVGERAGGDGRLVLIAMGERGLASRVLAERFGSAWSYAGLQAGVGQVTPSDLLDLYGYRRIGRQTAVYGLTGQPLGHSVSPAMHNAALQALGIDAVYLPLPAADVDDFVSIANALGLRGASVTVPYKVAVMDRLDEVTPAARRIGAVNTIRIADGRWAGDNTDVNGFLEPLAGRLALPGVRAAVLGAGGSARAIVAGLASAGARVTVHARQADRAHRVAEMAGGAVGAWPPPRGSWDLLVNCTPVGMHPGVAESPIAAADLTGRMVYDLVYNPETTQLMKDAAAAGLETIGGLDMLVAQARGQFRWWTGQDPPAGVMRAAAVARLARLACSSGPSHHETDVV
jgi:shikimate dehydrogenase